jgi:hypothetical protein
MAPSKFLVFLLIAGVVSASWLGSAEAGSSASPVFAVNTKDGFALKGYDPVAYFTVGQPTKGVDQYTYRWALRDVSVCFRRQPSALQG